MRRWTTYKGSFSHRSRARLEVPDPKALRERASTALNFPEGHPTTPINAGVAELAYAAALGAAGYDFTDQ